MKRLATFLSPQKEFIDKWLALRTKARERGILPQIDSKDLTYAGWLEPVNIDFLNERYKLFDHKLAFNTTTEIVKKRKVKVYTQGVKQFLNDFKGAKEVMKKSFGFFVGDNDIVSYMRTGKKILSEPYFSMANDLEELKNDYKELEAKLFKVE